MLQPTIGVDFATKTIEYKDHSLKLQIWDSAGQERYKALIPSYVRGASIIFIVYDVSNKSSFTNLITWINFIKQVNTDESMLVLCGNKIDLTRQVSTNDGRILAEKEKVLFFETSAKNSININHMMFSCIANLPFFEQFADDKDNIIQELENNNTKTTEPGIFEIDIEKNNELNQEVPSELVVIDQKLLRKGKKKCAC